MKVKNKILTMVALTVLTCATYSSIGYADTSDKNTDTSVVTTTLSEEKRSDELDQSSTGSSSENESSSSSEPETNPSTNPPTTEPSQPSPSEENKPDGRTKTEIGNNKDISSGTKVLISEDSIKNLVKQVVIKKKWIAMNHHLQKQMMGKKATVSLKRNFLKQEIATQIL